MNLAHCSAALNFAGAVAVGLSNQFGLAAGFGGPIVWKNAACQIVNGIGWLMLIGGFGLQWMVR
jgi:hypothetical protein